MQPMSSLAEIKVYATYPHECSYLDDKEATTLFIDPHARVDKQLYSRLSELGFRRSGPHIYKPHCQQCQACIPARIPSNQLQTNRAQRRILKRNQDLDIREVESIDLPEYYALYERYINARHSDGDMHPPSREQYLSFLTREWQVTRYYVFYDGEQPLAVCVLDALDHGLSAVYTFFDPDLPQRSLGTFAILWQAHKAAALGLDYLYLGYWIEGCRKMAYKGQFQPLEILIDGSWQNLSDHETL